jgi:hypothetical protein
MALHGSRRRSAPVLFCEIRLLSLCGAERPQPSTTNGEVGATGRPRQITRTALALIDRLKA